MKLIMFYFGAYREAGHYLWVPGVRRCSREQEWKLPFDYRILDCGLLPQRAPEVQGKGYLSHINGWTVLTFWDRSCDSRQRSNSAFLCPGQWNFEEMVTGAKTDFPDVWNRFTFTVLDAAVIDSQNAVLGLQK